MVNNTKEHERRRTKVDMPILRNEDDSLMMGGTSGESTVFPTPMYRTKNELYNMNFTSEV